MAVMERAANVQKWIEKKRQERPGEYIIGLVRLRSSTGLMQ